MAEPEKNHDEQTPPAGQDKQQPPTPTRFTAINGSLAAAGKKLLSAKPAPFAQKENLPDQQNGDRGNDRENAPAALEQSGRKFPPGLKGIVGIQPPATLERANKGAKREKNGGGGGWEGAKSLEGGQQQNTADRQRLATTGVTPEEATPSRPKSRTASAGAENGLLSAGSPTARSNKRRRTKESAGVAGSGPQPTAAAALVGTSAGGGPTATGSEKDTSGDKNNHSSDPQEAIVEEPYADGRDEIDTYLDGVEPTPAGFEDHIIKLNPLLRAENQWLVERIATQQVTRYNTLITTGDKHLGTTTKHTCDGEAAHPGRTISQKSFPPGVPMPPTKVLPAQFKCQLCCQTRKFTKISDWTMHVQEDVQPFTCTWKDCGEPKLFKRKADWVRHENESHRHLEWWKCDVGECTHVCFRRDNFLQHLIREHKFVEPKVKTKAAIKLAGRSDPTWQKVKECHQETTDHPTHEPCRFCGKTFNEWKKLTVHLANHMTAISLPVLRLVARVAVETDIINATGKERTHVSWRGGRRGPGTRRPRELNAEAPSLSMAAPEESHDEKVPEKVLPTGQDKTIHDKVLVGISANKATPGRPSSPPKLAIAAANRNTQATDGDSDDEQSRSRRPNRKRSARQLQDHDDDEARPTRRQKVDQNKNARNSK
ncbi:Transcription factor IIIA [Coniochaeta hoffmannii]|uniref:Transcription factor IIIA n=1 Tax=Coniochaeta hoffmannii TaxID=91930 RepID=A0AA38S210_9PEZI|nr:Transcription factor IIIA [Coniochaeta hoffmannii]